MARGNVKALAEAQEALAEAVDDNADQLGPEEMPLVDDADELPAGDESRVDEEIEWKATHRIGDFIVQERKFANGLPYWVEETGKRRRPTEDRPLRRYVPRPDEAHAVVLDRDAMALCMTAFMSYETIIEDGQNVAAKVGGTHVLLSLWDRKAKSHDRYLVQIPEAFEVIGAKAP